MLGKSAPPLLIGAAMALTSGGVFVSQLLLSTFLDMLFFSDFRFVLVSLALFGLGAGGVSFALVLRRNVLSTRRLTIVCGALYAGTALVPFAVPQLLHQASLLEVELLVIVFTCFANYLFAGGLIASLLTFRSRQVPLLYAVDLFGATSMGIIAIYIADTFGFFASVRFLFLVAFAAFVCIWMYFGTYARRVLIAGAVALLAAGIVLAVPLEVSCGKFQVQKIYDRGGIPSADVGELVGQATNSFSHMSLYELQSSGTFSSIRILINCAVPTQGVKANQLSDVSNLNNRISVAEFRSWPFVFNPPQSSLIIGSGAGIDVVRALAVGGEKVTAVDINPLTFQLVRRHRPDLSLPFGDPKVTTIVGDGRSYAAASAEKYDLIFLAVVKNFHQPWGLQSFTSHNLYTVEAFATYKDKLTPGGMLVIYDWQWYTRPHLVTLQELLRRESESSDERVMVFTGKTAPREIIFYKNAPFSDAERRAAGSDTSSREFIFNETPMSILLSGIPRSVTTDDMPFLSQAKSLQSSYFRELPYRTLLNEGRAPRGVWSWVVVGSILAMGLLLVLFRSTELTGWRAVKPAYFFIGISFGLASLEFVMINKATLLLGNPVYAYAIAIAAVLSAGALGSIIAYRFDVGKYLRACSASMALLLLAYYVVLPAIAASMVFSFSFKVFVIFVVASIPGVLAGMIFPIAFQKACRHGETYSLWMWGIDAFAFVVAYFVISAVVVKFGVGTILLLGAMGYAVAAVTARSLDD